MKKYVLTIDIPDNIQFVISNKGKYGILFNDYRQILTCEDDGLFEVIPYNNRITHVVKRTPCVLVECKYIDLSIGDIFIAETEGAYKKDLFSYFIYTGLNEVIYISNSKNIITNKIDPTEYISFFKVVKK